ncbi:MAG TPA: nicotinamide riboside transporter PnuC [Steroidobacteraceae bacterium]|nr:nicotinamide riboside transporter PnuC [Steroidobacteraceae bacterium]
MIDALARELRATSHVEILAVALGLIYVLLIYRRQRLGWIAGAASSIIYVYLAARAHLPMQSLLQFYYVVMSVYGWCNWTRTEGQLGGGIERWPLRHHLLAGLAIALLSVLTAQVLRRETHAAWPYLDSLTTWTSLFATWLVARLKLENWLYWIAADSIMVYLFAAQGYPFSAALFLSYVTIAVFGFRAWLRRYRLQLA